MGNLLNYFFTPEPKNKKVFLFFIDGKLDSYALCGGNRRKDRIDSTLYCLRNDLKGILVFKRVSASYMGYLAKNFERLNREP